MTRDEKIQYLVDELMTRILDGEEDMLLMHYLLTDFKNMSEKELDDEIARIKALQEENAQ